MKARFLAKAEGASPGDVQLPCARATGKYKKGNESLATRVRSSWGRFGGPCDAL